MIVIYKLCDLSNFVMYRLSVCVCVCVCVCRGGGGGGSALVFGSYCCVFIEVDMWYAFTCLYHSLVSRNREVQT